MAIAKQVEQIAFALWQQQAGARWLPVTGHSMLPLLRAGDQLLVVPQVTYQLGDIVVFQQDATILVHRVVATMPQGRSPDRKQRSVDTRLSWVTRGDNCQAVDPPVAMAQMIGKVVALQRGSVTCSLVGWGWTVMNRLLIYLAHRQRPGARRLLLRLMARYLHWRLLPKS